MKIKNCINREDEFIIKVSASAKASQSKLNAVVTFCDVENTLNNRVFNNELKLNRVPIALKDNVNTMGVRTTASSRILDNYIPVYNATIVEKLEAAGAITIAKTSMDELGMGGTNLNAYTGKVNNPWDVNRISGGSSGGSAALVGEGIVPIAIGTDTGDSVRKPAAYCGVVGLKPTYGRISRYGIIPYASSLDHVGIFSTTVRDAAATLEVIAGRDEKDMTTSEKPVEDYSKLLNSAVNGKRIGIIKNVYDAVQDKNIIQEFDALLRKLKNRGATIEWVTFDEHLMNALLPTYYVISNAEATANHSNLDGIRFGMREPGESLNEIMINSRTKGFSSDVRKRFVIGSYSLFVENQDKIFRKAQKVRRVIVESLSQQLADLDALLSIATPSTAPSPESSHGEELNATYLIAENHMLLGNFSGYPSITIPNAKIDGLPVGVNLLSKPFEEVTMLGIAKAIEEECGLEGLCVEVNS